MVPTAIVGIIIDPAQKLASDADLRNCDSMYLGLNM